MTWIPFNVMLDVMEFSLDYTFVRMPNGDIKKQKFGTVSRIPDRWGRPAVPGNT